jgi:DNA-binding transcriptional LysR family regulator
MAFIRAVTSRSAIKHRAIVQGRQPIDLRLLQVFMAISESGTMTSAARQLGQTQSAVSQSLQQLEHQLKVSLFARDQRPLRLTPAGHFLRQRAAGLLAQAIQLPNAVQEMGSAVLPEIRIGLVDSFAATVGPYLIRELLQSAVHLSVYGGPASTHAEALRRRDVELIITSDPVYDIDRLERHSLLQEPFILLTPAAIARDAIASETNGLSLDELAARYPLIRYTARSAEGAQVERHLRRLGVRAPTTVEIESSDTLVAMVAAGCGWAITTPLCYLQGRAYAKGIVATRLPGPAFRRSLVLIAHAGDYAELPRKVSQQARHILKTIVLSEMQRLGAWMTDELVIGPLPVGSTRDFSAVTP